MGGPLPTVGDIVAELRAAARPENVAGMARYGISSAGTLGVSIPILRAIDSRTRAARRADPEGAHALALELWDTGVHEARILAGLLDVPALVTPEQADRWAAQLDSWDVCDGLCNNLLRKTPFAHAKAAEWSSAKTEFVKRAGFVLMCALAVHDKGAPDAVFLGYLEIVEREADDDRLMVKKAVNWALRQIGKRDRVLHAAALETGERIGARGTRSARWIAADALRELRDEHIVARIRA